MIISILQSEMGLHIERVQKWMQKKNKMKRRFGWPWTLGSCSFMNKTIMNKTNTSPSHPPYQPPRRTLEAQMCSDRGANGGPRGERGGYVIVGYILVFPSAVCPTQSPVTGMRGSPNLLEVVEVLSHQSMQRLPSLPSPYPVGLSLSPGWHPTAQRDDICGNGEEPQRMTAHS